MNIYDYWILIHRRDEEALRDCFLSNALIRNHNTQEEFTVEKFLNSACKEAPPWDGELERVEEIGSLIVAVSRIRMGNGQNSFHAVSFIHLMHEKIASVDRYMGADQADCV